MGSPGPGDARPVVRWHNPLVNHAGPPHLTPRTTRPRRAPLAVTVVVVGLNLVGNLVADGATAGAAVLLVAGARTAGAGWEELGLSRSQIPAGLRWGLSAALVVAAVVAAGLAVPGVRQGLEGARPPAGAGPLLVELLVRIPLGTALPEEVIFRGVLLAVLSQAWGTAVAVVASSAAFGVWHVLPTLDQGNAYAGGLAEVLVAVAATTAVGPVLCWLRLPSGGILAPALAHWTINAAGLLAARAAS